MSAKAKQGRIRPREASRTALAAASPRPAGAASAGGALGDSGSAAAVRRLDAHLASVNAERLQRLLRQTLSDLRAGRHSAAAVRAQRAIELDERCGLAWHVLAICHEQAGDFTAALNGYEQALALMPQEPEIANDLGRLALKMGMAGIAEQLFSPTTLSASPVPSRGSTTWPARSAISKSSTPRSKRSAPRSSPIPKARCCGTRWPRR
jgi:Flp pilus assembly protein TadD